MTRKMTSVTLVHIIRCWKGTLVSGTCTSGMRGVKGLTRSRKRTVGAIRQLVTVHSFSRDMFAVQKGRGMNYPQECTYVRSCLQLFFRVALHPRDIGGVLNSPRCERNR